MNFQSNDLAATTTYFEWKSKKDQNKINETTSVSLRRPKAVRIQFELNQEQGTSSWLTTISLTAKGYDLTKQLFWDLIQIRYGLDTHKITT